MITLPPWISRHFKAAGLVLAGFVIVATASAALLHRGARTYLYRQTTYQLLADRVAGNDQDPQRVAIRMNDYIAENMYPGGGPVMDQTVLRNFIRGIGWCDQDAWALGTLLDKRGIAARPVFLKDAHGASPHTMAEVLLDGHWRLFDPMFGLVFPNPRTGRLATWQEVSDNPSLILEHPRVLALPASSRGPLLELFSRLFPAPMAPERWQPPSGGSLPRRIVGRSIRLVLRSVGPRPAYLLQDLVLALLPDRLPALDVAAEGSNLPVTRTRAEDPAVPLFYKARSYHLFGRTALAEQYYDQIIRHHRSRYGEESAFFRSLISLESRNEPERAVVRLRRFQQEFPDSPMASRAAYWLGRSYERMGRFALAAGYYQQGASDPNVPAAYRLAEMNQGRSQRF